MQGIIKYLDLAIYWLIVFIPFSIAIAPAIVHTFIWVTVFLFLVKKIVKKEKLFINTPLNLAFMCLIFISVISIKNSVNFGDSIHGIVKLLHNAMIFLICAEEIKDKKHIEKIIISICAGASLISIDALWQLISGRDFIRGNALQSAINLVRVTASFPNPNVMGVYLSAITPLIIGLTLFYYRGREKIIMSFVSLLAVMGIFLTFSRGAGLGLYLSILFLSIARKNKTILVILIVILLVFPFIMPKNIKVWVKEINYDPLVFMFNYDRISMYRNSLNMISHHPLVGVGVNTFTRNYLKYKLPEPENAKTSDAIYAHNNFLHMAGEIGLLGLGCFLWILFNLFKTGIWLYQNLKEEYLKIVAISLIACFIAFLINGLTETSLYYSRVAMIFWYLIGLSLALIKFSDGHKTGTN
jgi:O-antigen ligase